MKKYSLACFLSVLFIILVQTSGLAQTRYLQKTIGITMPTVLDLELSSGANPVADFNTTSKIDAGISLPNQTIIKYRSNKAWFVTIRTNVAEFSGGTVGSPMPVSVIKYRLNSAGGSYTPLSVVEQPLLASSSSRSVRGTGTDGVDFLIDPGYIYAPAQDYTIQIIYTISNL